MKSKLKWLNILVLIVFMFVNAPLSSAENSNNSEEASVPVQLSKCTDGDTAHVLLDDNDVTLRFLAIDTPETKKPGTPVEPFGKEASEYTCNALNTAEIITLEYDENSDKEDKYDRQLVWIFVDGELLQKKLVEQGLAKIAYVDEKYFRGVGKYVQELELAQHDAKEKNSGIWQ